MSLSCLLKLEKHLLDIVRLSGRGPFHIGKYNECVANPEMEYNMIGLGPNTSLDVAATFGVCLPSHCTPDAIRTGMNAILDKAGLPLHVNAVLNGLEDYQYPFNFSFFLTVFCLIFLVTLVGMATCSQRISQHKVMGAFSLQKSMKVFKYHPNGRLNVLNGVKALSMLWVILGHEYALGFAYVINLLTLGNTQLKDWKLLMIVAGYFAVDIFFFVGGFLLAYSFLKQATKSLTLYPLAILNRYLRIVPAYLAAIMIFYCFLLHLSSGPLTPPNQGYVQNCSSLWKPLLFIDNLVDNGKYMCMSWGWYLQCDMQMFLFSLLLLLIYRKSSFWCYIGIFVSSAASCAYTFQQSFDNQYKNVTHISDTDTNGKYTLDLEYKPWSRCPPYFYGLFLGILYHQFSQQQKLQQNGKHFFLTLQQFFIAKPWGRRLFELTGVLMFAFICFIPRTAQGNHYWSQLTHCFYLTYGKIVVVVGVSMVILPSMLSKDIKSLARFVLDTKIFNFMAKVSFCTYLIHLTLLMQYSISQKTDVYFYFWTLFPVFAAHAVLSILLGFLLTILVEIPFSHLQKSLMAHFSKSSANNEQQKAKPAEGSLNELEEPVGVKALQQFEEMGEKGREAIGEGKGRNK